VTEASTKPARRRWWKYLLILFAGGFLGLLTLLIYVNTQSFQSLVRRRVIAEVERVTGGRVEIGSIHTTPFRLQADVREITVHGRESATEAPLAHVDRITARLKLSSLLRSELGFHEVILDQPVVHVAFYPGGGTNFPQRSASPVAGKSSVEQLFALSINHFELRHGQILWDDQTVPVDFDVRDMALHMDYSYLHTRYDGRLRVGMVDTKLLGFRPFAWMTSAEFSLGADSAFISSLTWNSGHSHFSGSGQVTDFRRPRLKASYEGQVDLTEAASLARRRDLRAGVLELKGSGEGSLDQFSTNGLLTLRDLTWQNDQISFSRAFVSTGYSLTDQQLKLSKIQGRIFGGSLTGEAELNQWLAPMQHVSEATRKVLDTAVISAARPLGKSAPKTPRQKPAIQSAFVSLRIRDLSAEGLLAALDAPAHPIPHFHPAASVSGTLETRWKGTPRDADIQFVLDLSPPEKSAAAQLRFSGHANGLYHAANDTLDLPQFNLTMPTSHVQASGKLSATSTVHLSVTTSSLADWLPFISAVRGPALFPVTLNGKATFDGTMIGSFSSPQLAGNLKADEFDVNLPATSRTHELLTHWDSLSASIQLSFHGIALHNAVLRREDMSAEFDASASLEHGHFTGDSALALRANLRNADLASLQALAGYDYPVFGKADLTLQAGGTIADPHGDGQIHLANATAYGEAIRQFDSSFHVAQAQIAFENMHLVHEDSIITGTAGYNSASRAFRLDLAGNNLNLAQIKQLNPNRLSVQGRADFVLKGSGTPAAPTINADVQLHNLTLDRGSVG
jgi:translocation and assembly module TamB